MSVKLIENGIFCGKIIVSPTASEAERYAARELRYYLNLMTGNKVPAWKKDEIVEDALVVMGSALPMYGEERKTYGDDELHWYTKNGKLFFDGGCRGLLYSVYDFLETYGCRFFAPRCEKVPTYMELIVPETDRTDSPAFEYREFYYDDCRHNPVMNAKYRTNGNYDVPEMYGGSMRYGIFVHSEAKLIPYAEYHEEHPDWFAMIDGSRELGDRQPGKWQLCLSNPEVLPKLIEETRKVLLANPGVRLMSVSQNDFGRGCECDACRAISEEEGSPAGLMLRIVNAVAEALEPEFPDVIFDTLAYTYTRPAPKITKPRHNVCVRLCSIECCFSHPLKDRCPIEWERKKTFAEDLEDWSKICDRIYVWDYNIDFRHLAKPHPNWWTLQPNMQLFVEHGVKGLFAQGNQAQYGGDMDELRAYLLTKLMWDPYCDLEKHRREFTDFFYGAAGPYILEYIDTICKKCQDDNIHVECYGDLNSPYLSPDMLEIYNAILDKAEMAVRDDTIRRMRVERIRLGLRYIVIRRRIMNENIHDAEEINKFFEDSRAHDLIKFEANCQRDATVQAFAEGIIRGDWLPKL